MPTMSELLIQQMIWDDERNIPKIRSTDDQIGKLWEEVWEIDLSTEPAERVGELVDVIILAHSVIGTLIHHLDIEIEDLDTIITGKMLKNEFKYPKEEFEHVTNEEELAGVFKRLKEEWNERSNL